MLNDEPLLELFQLNDVFTMAPAPPGVTVHCNVTVFNGRVAAVFIVVPEPTEISLVVPVLVIVNGV